MEGKGREGQSCHGYYMTFFLEQTPPSYLLNAMIFFCDFFDLSCLCSLAVFSRHLVKDRLAEGTGTKIRSRWMDRLTRSYDVRRLYGQQRHEKPHHNLGHSVCCLLRGKRCSRDGEVLRTSRETVVVCVWSLKLSLSLCVCVCGVTTCAVSNNNIIPRLATSAAPVFSIRPKQTTRLPEHHQHYHHHRHCLCHQNHHHHHHHHQHDFEQRTTAVAVLVLYPAWLLCCCVPDIIAHDSNDNRDIIAITVFVFDSTSGFDRQHLDDISGTTPVTIPTLEQQQPRSIHKCGRTLLRCMEQRTGC